MTQPTDDRDVASIVLAANVEPSDEFRRELAARIRSRSSDDDVHLRPAAEAARGHRWTWTLLAAATIVALIVGVVFVAGRSDDGAVELVPAETDPAPVTGSAGLAGDELFAELEGRRWLALERVDDPSPTVLTSDVTFIGSADRPVIVAHDGCNVYGGTFRFDGTTIVDVDIAGEGESCEVDVLALGDGQQIELFTDGSSFLLLDPDGAPIARFTALDTLDQASAADMPGLRHLDRLEAVEFTDTGRGVALCTLLAWESLGDRVVVTLPDPDATNCGAAGFERSPVATKLRDLTTDGAEVLITPNGLLLVGDLGAIELRDLPIVAIDPDRVTIAAGALFGVRPGLGVTPDRLIEAVDPMLGAPDQDTGWIDRRNDGPPTQTCGLNDFREIAWGDLVAGFWGSGSRTVLLYWYVGDERVVQSNTPESELTEPTVASNLITEQGVGIGDDADAIPDRFNVVRGEGIEVSPGDTIEFVIVATRNPDSTFDNLASPTLGGVYLIVDDTVVGFGAGILVC